MSGFLGPESSAFWSHTVLRWSQCEPAVCQALVAMSSLHLGYHAGQYNEEALRQHGKAMRTLQKRLGGKDPAGDQKQTAMICCVIFYCFESALGHSETAMKHLESGLQILASARHGAGESMDGGDEIVDVLARLDLQATMFNDDRMPSLDLVSAAERQAGIAELRAGWDGGNDTGRFHSIKAAQTALNRLQNWLFRFLIENIDYKGRPLEEIPLHVMEEKSRLAYDYARWSVLFDRFIEQRQKLQKKKKDRSSSMEILSVQHRLILWLLEFSMSDNTALFWAEVNLEAHSLLDSIENVIYNNAKDGNADNGTAGTSVELQRTLSSETGVVAPLFLLAVKCADETITARATRILATCRRREGLYDSEAMTGVLKKLYAMREQTLRSASEGDTSSLQGGGRKSHTHVPLEFWDPGMIESRSGGFDTIGGNISMQ